MVYWWKSVFKNSKKKEKEISELTPQQTKKFFREMKWQTVVGF